MNKIPQEISYRLLDPYSELDDVKNIWTSLLKKCRHDYFQSWIWTEMWIESLPADSNLKFVAGFINDQPAIAFFLGYREFTRHKFFNIRQLSINTTLLPYYDSVYRNHNSILIDPKIELSLDSILENIPTKTWDELQMLDHSFIHCPNLVFGNNLAKKYNLHTNDKKSYYVDLEQIRVNDFDYLTLVSHNRRKKIRRAIKEYEKIGEIKTDVAENLESALIIFEEMAELHQKEWVSRGMPGHYSNPYFKDFHRNLIMRRFNHGEVQLIRIYVGEHTIGCSYNLIYNNEVLVYTNGINNAQDNLLRPRFISHLYAILHNAKIGFSRYDFLEGSESHKISLSTNSNNMLDLEIQRKRTVLFVENIAVKLYKAYQIVISAFR